MLIDFSKVDLNERPVLLLCNADGTPIQYLGYAFNVDLELHYNETSSLSFDYPAVVDGNDVPNYDAIVGMREVLWQDVGYFILTNPEERNDGIKRIKSCKAHSAEYEFTYKTLTLEEGTYDFYDPVDSSNTVIGRIMELMPSWSIGSVDSALVGKYRTFDTVSDNVYNFIKSTVQDTYQCIFDFDTMNRRVHVRSVNSDVDTKPVYLSTSNLAKEIKIEEQTEDIFTCLDVNGADGVDIRSVNPLGTNKIYDLSYFMTEANVGKVISDKYQRWSDAYDAARLPYFNTTVEMVLEQARLETERAKLTTLNGEKSTLEEQLAVYVESAAQGVDGVQSNITDIKAKITAKEAEISAQKTLLTDIQTRVDSFFDSLQQMNDAVAFSAYFTDDEMKTLNKYIKEDSIQDSSFVTSEVSSYTASDRNESITSGSFSFSNAKIMLIATSAGKNIYSITGGTIQIIVNGSSLSASVVRGAIERTPSDSSFVLTAYLNQGTFTDSAGETSSFPSGCVSMSGACGEITHNCVKDADTGAWSDGTQVSSATMSGYFYLTENATEYQKRAVEWDLFEYGMEQLHSMSWPSYTFSVDSCNFLVPEEFIAFRNQLALGKKIYLDINGSVLEPILIGCSFSFEDLASLTLEFGDKYNCRDARFDLTDLLDQSISSGKSADFNKYNYNAFIDSGASNSVLNFIQSALDAGKNAVLAGKDQAIVIDQSGIRLRKSDGKGGYLDEQIWAINNSIVFTDDNWNTAKMAIGKFVDANLGECWGIVAPNIIGTLLAGNNLVIESSKKSGDVAVFRVDANGAQLHNAKFDLVKGNGQIDLYPETGLVGGNSTAAAPLFTYDANGDISGVRTASGASLLSVNNISKTDLPNANFWLDMNGNAYFKGKVFATDGDFTGTIHATDGDFSGTIKAATLSGSLVGANGGAIKGVSLGIGGTNYDNFVVDSNGNVTMNGNIVLNGSISWSSSPVQYQFSVDGKTNWHSTMTSDDLYRRDSLDGGKTWGNAYQFRGVNGKDGQNGEDGSDANVPSYIKSTYIDATAVGSCALYGNNIYANGTFTLCDITQRANGTFSTSNTYGYMGLANGRDASGNTTEGVAMTSGDESSYVIVTNAGARLQGSGAAYVAVTANSATIGYGLSSDSSGNLRPTFGVRVDANGARYMSSGNWVAIGGNTATWG